MEIKFLFFIIFQYFITLSQPFDPNITREDTICEYYMDEKRGYVAKCPNLFLKNDEKYVRFTGDLLEETSNEEVKYLEIVPPSNIAIVPSRDIFNYFVNLENLDARNVNIQLLDFIVNCFPLVYINLSHNYIKDIIHDSFFFCRDLMVLDLSHNYIEDIHESTFGRTKNLMELNLSHNKITSITRKHFKSIKKLTKLNLEMNQIKRLEFNIFNDLYDLKTLDLSNNPISMFDARLFDFIMFMEWLDLSDTGTKKFTPGLFKSLKRLKYLDISSNPLHKLDGETLTKNSELVELRMNDCSLSNIGKTFFDKITKLNTIEAKGNQCVDGTLKGTIDDIISFFDTCIKNSDRREQHNGEL